MSEWRMFSTLGTWNRVSRGKAFRFYARIDLETEEVWMFADYRCDEVVVRHCQLLPYDTGNELSFLLARNTAEIMTPKTLEKMKGGWMLTRRQKRLVKEAGDDWPSALFEELYVEDNDDGNNE